MSSSATRAAGVTRHTPQPAKGGRRPAPHHTTAARAPRDARQTGRALSARASGATHAALGDHGHRTRPHLGRRARRGRRFGVRAGPGDRLGDDVSITPGTGCSAVAGDATKVKCTAFKQANAFKQFFVDAEAGEDTVINATTTPGVTGAPMRAIGDGGNDLLVGANQVNDVLEGFSGADTLRGGDEFGGSVNDELKGGAGNDRLEGGAGSDRLEGSTQSDELDGGDGPDRLDGGSHADVIDGGLADSGGWHSEDMVVYDRVSPVTVDLRRSDFSQGEPDEKDKIVRVENVMSGSGNDTLTGNAENNDLIAGPGNDVVSGMQGEDTLLGGEGNDFLFPSPDNGFIGVLADAVTTTAPAATPRSACSPTATSSASASRSSTCSEPPQTPDPTAAGESGNQSAPRAGRSGIIMGPPSSIRIKPNAGLDDEVI